MRNGGQSCHCHLALVSLAAVLFVWVAPAAAQTWIGPGTDWNSAANWFPAVIPNSGSATASFTGNGVGTVNISTSVQDLSLAFTNPSGAYTLTSNSGQTLSSLNTITIGTQVTGTETITLATVAAGSIQFIGNLSI